MYLELDVLCTIFSVLEHELQNTDTDTMGGRMVNNVWSVLHNKVKRHRIVYDNETLSHKIESH